MLMEVTASAFAPAIQQLCCVVLQPLLVSILPCHLQLQQHLQWQAHQAADFQHMISILGSGRSLDQMRVEEAAANKHDNVGVQRQVGPCLASQG